MTSSLAPVSVCPHSDEEFDQERRATVSSLLLSFVRVFYHKVKTLSSQVLRAVDMNPDNCKVPLLTSLFLAFVKASACKEPKL